MKQRLTWNRVAQGMVVLLAVLALKFYYSSASANALRWILAPTAKFVELTSGTTFEFESYAGYVTSDRGFVIAPACAGINFLIAAFLMLSLSRLRSPRSPGKDWRFIGLAALTAYLVTLLANTVRIVIALQLRELSETSGFKAGELHRVEGILVYAGFLLLLFIVSEKMSAEKPTGLLRLALFPLLVYYATTLGIPLANGGYRQGAAFWEHAVFVLLIPLLLLLPLALFNWLWRRMNQAIHPGAKASEAIT